MVKPPSIPYGGRHANNWPAQLSTVGNFVLTVLAFQLWLRHVWSGPQTWSALSLVYVLSALPLIGCILWLIGRAHGFRTQVTIILSTALGVLADVLVLRGLTLSYRSGASLPGLELALLWLVSASLIALAFSANADGLRRQVRERQAGETDALTGLLNRNGLSRRYAELPAGATLTVVMLDLNDLKAINDRGGHGAGDRHLQHVARALRQSLPPEAFVGRWGGDEFVMVVRGELPPLLMTTISAAAAHPTLTMAPFAHGSAVVVSGTPLDRALAQADQHMYDDKARHHAERTRRRHDQAINATDFPHYLLTLTSEDAIIRRGLWMAAKLADFGSWFHIDLVRQRVYGQSTLDSPVEDGAFATVTQPDNLVMAAARQRATVWAADYAGDPRAQPHWVATGLKSMVATPVLSEGQVVGLIGFMSHHTWRSVTPQARQLLEAVATHLGHHLERHEALQRLQASVEAAITGMGAILEARDLETAGHTERVVALAAQLGRAAGLDATDLHALRLGAYLHDVGKLAIPDAVLLKPGPLDDAEWALMRTHPERGAALAARWPSLPPEVLAVVRQHHEHWNGQGYPERRSGEDIHLLARIFALCDVYDALVNVRPYKRAWTRPEARAELAAQSGRQFDPWLTQLFLQHVVPTDEELVAADGQPTAKSAGRSQPQATTGH